MTAQTPQLSRIRTFLFGGLALVWFTEMLFLGFQSFSTVWTDLWQVDRPDDPQLVTALYITWAVGAPAKGALFVLAVFGLRSENPSVRTALFASMALVPPLNIAFPFRYQGFLFEPVAVATILSSILWGSFFLFGEPARPTAQNETSGSSQLSSSRQQIFQDGWFAAYSTVLTLMALLFLFWPRTAQSFILPCLSGLLSTHETELSSLIHVGMAGGTHLLALATAFWIATLHGRSHPALRKAVASAGTVHAGLFFVFPLRQIVVDFGGSCAASSGLMLAAPLLIGWVLYAAAAYRVTAAKDAPLLLRRR
jgi:hypothetical protein